MLIRFRFSESSGDSGQFTADCESAPRIGETVLRGDGQHFEVAAVTHSFVQSGPASAPPVQMLNVLLSAIDE